MVFDFIPRSVGKQQSQTPLIRQGPKAHVECVVEQATPAAIPGTNLPAKSSERVPNDEELSVLIELSLSDYSFWNNPDLHHKLRSGKDGCW